MHKIVFIHPDQKLQTLYKKSLSEHFQIDSAYNGLQGLRLIQKMRPNLIISEYNLPVLSGESLLRFVRNHHELFPTPFLFLSSNHPAAETLGLGANEWIVASQSTPESLLAKCHQHLKVKTFNYV